MLAGVAGGVLVAITGISSGIGGPISIKAFLMVMIGGAGVVPGAIAGGFILGIAGISRFDHFTGIRRYHLFGNFCRFDGVFEHSPERINGQAVGLITRYWKQ